MKFKSFYLSNMMVHWRKSFKYDSSNAKLDSYKHSFYFAMLSLIYLIRLHYFWVFFNLMMIFDTRFEFIGIYFYNIFSLDFIFKSVSQCSLSWNIQFSDVKMLRSVEKQLEQKFLYSTGQNCCDSLLTFSQH